MITPLCVWAWVLLFSLLVPGEVANLVLDLLAEYELSAAVQAQPGLHQDRDWLNCTIVGVEAVGGSINLRKVR